MAKKGEGYIISIKDSILKAQGAKFTESIKKDSKIFIKEIKITVKIESVINDNEIKLIKYKGKDYEDLDN